MAVRSKLYSLDWPLTPEKLLNIDEMFEILFDDAANRELLPIDLTDADEVTGILPPASGGTGLASYAIGDLLYASAVTVLSRLAAVATGNVLLSGGVATAPAWGKVDLTAHITGNLPVAHLNSGTDASADTFWRGDGTWAEVGSEGSWGPLTNGNPATPELIFNADGDTVDVFTPF
jgi:hypothetical protein